MTISHLHRLVRTLGAAALLAGGAGCTSYPSAPSSPVFDTDVLPIFEAHCTRCHGDGPMDGGQLNQASGLVDAGAAAVMIFGPCLNRFGGTNPDASFPFCLGGANEYAGNGQIKLAIHSTMLGFGMPPPPAPKLNSYELGVIDAWVAQSPRKCSNSSSPDPALVCTPGSYP